MIHDKTPEYLISQIRELCQLPKETEWVEFKHNNNSPEEIGEYISALSNSAALLGKANGYLVWGIDDDSHEIIGTNFRPSKKKKGNEELESWLLRLLQPRIHFHFNELEIEGHHVSMLEIPCAVHQPVCFHGTEYIRIGSCKKKLKEYSEKERALWRIFDTTPFEQQLAAERITAGDVLQLLDYPAYFKLLNVPLPDNRKAILNQLSNDRIIQPNQSNHWDILNIGAILFASNLSQFNHLARKAVRVVEYDGAGRVQTKQEHEGQKGYAAGFEGLIDFLKARLPGNEVIGEALRKSVPMYPELAIRELVANVMIHQDFTMTGTGPMVEIFDGRLEITNPGEPLIDTARFLDNPPRSRNEALASFFRRIGICEERGSGIDKIVFQTELYQLPAPLFEVTGRQTRAVLFAHKPFKEMDKFDRLRACYLHACLQYVSRAQMTNSTLRQRFGIEAKNGAQISRVIRDAIEAKLIKPYNPESESRKHASYVPIWA